MTSHCAYCAVSLSKISLYLLIEITHVLNNLSLPVECLIRLLHQPDSLQAHLLSVHEFTILVN